MAETKNPSVTTLSLQMLSRPELLTVEAPVPHLTIERIMEPPVPFYRRMYEAVGGKWNWSERKTLTDEQVKAIIQHSDVFIYVMREHEKIVGFAELDFRNKPDIELKYFGLVPESIGKGFGIFLLARIIEYAWSARPKRVWLHTCSNDHPRALETYKKAGFVVYKEERQSPDIRFRT